MKLSEKLRALDACGEAVEWAEDYDARTYEEALAACQKASYLCFLVKAFYDRDLIGYEPIFAAGDAVIALGIADYSAAEYEMGKLIWRDRPERYLYRVLEQYFKRHPIRHDGNSHDHINAIRAALGPDLIAAMRAFP